MSLYQYEIGLTSGAMTNVENLVTGFPAPKSVFRPYSSYVTLGDGTVKGVGFPEAEWKWGFLKWNVFGTTYRDALSSIITIPSSFVYIKTRKNDSSDSYVTYYAIAVWPKEENRESERRIDFTILFKFLKVV